MVLDCGGGGGQKENQTVWLITCTRLFFRGGHRIGKWTTRDIYTKMTTNTQKVKKKKKSVYWCLLACLFYSFAYLLFGSGSINYPWTCFFKSKSFYFTLASFLFRFFFFFLTGGIDWKKRGEWEMRTGCCLSGADKCCLTKAFDNIRELRLFNFSGGFVINHCLWYCGNHRSSHLHRQCVLR